MNRIAALLLVLPALACTDMVSEPAGPGPGELPGVYTGLDAVRRMAADLRSEIGHAPSLQLSAALNGQSVEERRAHVEKAIAHLDAKMADGAAMNSMACASDPYIFTAIAGFTVVPPLFDGEDQMARYSGYTEASGPAPLNTEAMAIHVHDRNWHGPPAVGGNEYHVEASTELCYMAQLVYEWFFPEEHLLPGVVWVQSIHRLTHPGGDVLTKVKETIGYIGKPKSSGGVGAPTPFQ